MGISDSFNSATSNPHILILDNYACTLLLTILITLRIELNLIYGD